MSTVKGVDCVMNCTIVYVQKREIIASINLHTGEVTSHNIIV